MTTSTCKCESLHLFEKGKRVGLQRDADGIPRWTPCDALPCTCAKDDCPRLASGDDGLCEVCRESGCKAP